MRAQLRTYHSIPSLQAHQDPNAYKQLQDAPRLKSILKGASEDSDQPNTIEKIKAATIPRTNPVNLIFVLSQYAPKVSETHFYPPRDFFDLVMRSTMSSKSRAKAFLWLVWWYLESDFSKEAAENNPFGRGQHGDFTDGLPLKVPRFDHLTEEQANAENIDTEPEKAYGEMKRLERKRILEEDETVGPPVKRTKKSRSAELLRALFRTAPALTTRKFPFNGCEVHLFRVLSFRHAQSVNKCRTMMLSYKSPCPVFLSQIYSCCPLRTADFTPSSSQEVSSQIYVLLYKKENVLRYAERLMWNIPYPA